MPSKTPKQKSFMAAVANNPKFAKKVGVSQQVGKEFEMKDKKKPVKKLAFGGMGGAKMNSAPASNPLGGAKMNSAPTRNPVAGATMNATPARNPVAGAQMNSAPARNPLGGAQMNANPDNYALAGATMNGVPTRTLRGTPDRPLTQAQIYNQERAIHKDPSSPFHSQYYPKAGATPAPAQGGIGRALGAAAAQPQQTPSPQQLQKMQQSLSGLGNLGRGNSQQVDPGGRIPTPGGAAQGFADLQQQQNMGRNAPTLGRFAKGGKVKQADGIAKKGKTATKMVKMAKGGSVSARADGIATKGKTNCKMPGMAKGGYAKGGRGCK
jgi:hypothetical protein